MNFTQFDHLSGIANRKNHPNIPEPEVAMIFKKKGSKSTEVDMNELEKRLKKSKKDVSIQFLCLFLLRNLCQGHPILLPETPKFWEGLS